MKPITILKNTLGPAARLLLVALLSGGITVSEAALLQLSNSPLYLITAVEPNIIVTFDDSGSMEWSYLPDGVSGYSGANYGCSSTVNKIYYDPTVTYTPPVDANGVQYPNASFTAAWINGFNTAAGTVNLATSYRPSWSTPTSYVTCGNASVPGGAFYYRYNGTGSTTSNTNYTRVQHSAGSTWTAAQQQNFANWYSYHRTRNMTAKSAIGRAFSLFGGNVRVAAQHLNNTCANGGTGCPTSTGTSNKMFTTTIAGTNTPAGAIQDFTGTYRTDFYERLYNTPTNGSTPLIPAAQRAGDYFTSSTSGKALVAGNVPSSTNSPYLDTPGSAPSSTNQERSCRQNFQVIMTDGFWNTPTGVAVGNKDGTAQTLGDGTSYTAKPPFKDTWSSTLADTTFYYWYNDLRTEASMPNTGTQAVPAHYSWTAGCATSSITATSCPSAYWWPWNDPASWQHLVTFTIGLGVPGALTYDCPDQAPQGPTDATLGATCKAVLNGTTNWQQACGTCTNPNVDDLWHAAFNSRGQYFSAANPTQLSSAFHAIVKNVKDRISSASAVALNGSTISGNSYVYQTRFNSADWSGQLLAYKIDPTTGGLSGTPSWDSGVQLNTQNYSSGRTILTTKPSTNLGIPLRWPSNPASPSATELDTSQSTWLNYNSNTASYDTLGSARLDYLRGDASNENAGYLFRPRTRLCGGIACPAGTNTGVLGDTIDSAPLYVAAPPYVYPDTFEAAPYSAFQSTWANRTPVVYVGANDGMLHAFNANTGLELMAYVPSPVYPNLSALSGQPYSHNYYVDGDPVASDVFINGAWRTILVGTLRHGGQGIYALDVTDPSNFTETNAPSVVKWEFTDRHDADLGDTFSTPVIAKLHNGKWAVIIGNGYNNSQTSTGTTTDTAVSTTGHAVLYILFIDQNGTGGWSLNSSYYKIDTGVGTTTTPNGLASPAVIDYDGDNVADYVYAGDLQGNMWRFDLTSSTPSNWTAAANRKIIYTAKDSASNPQPITSRPVVSRHPSGLPGFMVYFGTGKYLETSDASIAGAKTQTFYGIWDNSGASNPTRTDLLQQTVISTQTVSGISYRVLSNNTMVWRAGTPPPSPSYIGWYLDLPTTGERVTNTPMLRSGAAIFTTVIPSSDPCSIGGSGWLMEINAANGGQLSNSPFDVNGDGTFSDSDLLTVSSGSGSIQAPAGGQLFTGIPAAPTVLIGGNPNVGGGQACGGKECKYINSSSGQIQTTLENASCTYCRAGWSQSR